MDMTASDAAEVGTEVHYNLHSTALTDRTLLEVVPKGTVFLVFGDAEKGSLLEVDVVPETYHRMALALMVYQVD